MTRRPLLRRYLLPALLVLGPGMILLVAGLEARRGSPTLASLTAILEVLRAVGAWLGGHQRPLGVSAMVAGFLTVLVAAGVSMASDRDRRPEVLTWIVAGLLLATLGGGAMGLWPVVLIAGAVLAVLIVRHPVGSRPLRTPSWVPVVLLAVLLVGAFLRCVLITRHSVGFGTHGAGHLQLSIDLVEHVLGWPSTSGHPFSPAVYLDEQSGPMAVVNALGFMIFGIGFAQARLTQALLGTITIGLAFLFGRRLMDARTGLVFAFIMAVAPWQVAISRFNDAEHVLAPLQALLAAWTVLWAERERTTASMVVAGFTCALGWYIYATNQAFLMLLVAYLMVRLLRGAVTPRQRWKSIAVFLVVFLAVSIPDFKATIHPGHLLPVRSGYQVGHSGLYALASPDRLGDNLRAAFRSLYVRAQDPWFARDGGGGLDGLVATLLPVGLIWCLAGLWNDRFRWPAILMLAWTGLGVLPAISLHDVEFRRLLLVELAAEVLAACVLVESARLIARSPAGRRFLLAVVPMAAVVWCAVATHEYWDRVMIFESASSTYHVTLARDVRDHLGKEPVIAVLAANGDQTPQHRDAVRLGDYSRVQALARRGIPMDRAFILTPIQKLGTVLARELRSSPHRARIVAELGLARQEAVAKELESVLGPYGSRVERRVVRDSLDHPVLVAWTVAAPPGP